MQLMNPNKIEAKFLRDLFTSFDASKLGYCVLRNHESLPDSLGGSDLDLAVLPEEKEQIAELVISVAKQYGGTPIVDYVASGRIIRLLGCHHDEWWGAAVDLFWMMEYRGIEYIPCRPIIERAKVYRGILVARDDDAAIIALMKELLSNGKTRKNYFSDAAKCYQENGEHALFLLRGGFSLDVVNRFCQLLNKGVEDKQELKQIASDFRNEVTGCGAGWLQKIPCRVLNGVRRYWRIARPVGSCFAVLGTDGSGKTTMITAITPILEKAFHSKLQYEHMRPNWLPALGVAIGKRDAGDGRAVTDPHSQKPSGFMGSLIRLVYYSFDYTIGYWVKVYPLLAKRPSIHLFDRYYFDFTLDPRRMRINLPNWVIRMAFILAPQPSLILCLGGDAETIYLRKPETSLEEVNRQVCDLKKLCENNHRAVWIDTGTSIDDSQSQIMHAIHAHLS